MRGSDENAHRTITFSESPMKRAELLLINLYETGLTKSFSYFTDMGHIFSGNCEVF